MSSFLNNHKVRGLRNNNPGNLIKTNIAWEGKIPNGKDEKFEQFVSIEYGIRAMAMDIVNDIRKGKNTIEKLIFEYAPPTENNTKSYIQSVCKSIGIEPNSIISNVKGHLLTQLILAILKVELGKGAKDVTLQMIQNGLRLVPHSEVKGVSVDTSDTNENFLSWKNAFKVVAVFFYSLFCLTI